MSNNDVDILVVNANELLTLKGSTEPRVREELRELGAIKDGAVAVKDGRILAVGRTDAVTSEVGNDAATVLDAKGKLVMPGFVDCHNHLIFAGSRESELEMKIKGLTYLDIKKRGGGILKTVRDTRAATLEQLVDSGRKRLDLMLRFGTTTAEAKSGYGLNLEDELKILKAVKKLDETHEVDLVSTFLGAHGLPPEFENYDDYTDELTNRILPKVADSKLAEFCDAFCDLDFFTVKQSRKILTKARSLGLKLKIHVDELAETGGSELAGELGVVSAEHLNYPSERGLRMMAEKGVVAVLMSACTYSMMSDNYADARRIIEAGVPVALGTDLTPNSWTESMQFVISLACHNMKMLPSEAIVASTINAAHAIDREGDVGSLEKGKLADVLMLDVPNHRHIPYHYGVNLVEKVIKKGKIVR